MRMIPIFLLAMLIAIRPVSVGADEQEIPEITLTASNETAPRKTEDSETSQRGIQITGMKYAYALKEIYWLDKRTKICTTSIGKPGPLESGWYGNDFMHLFLGNRRLMEGRVIGEIVEEGKRGLIEYRFEGEWGKGRVSILLLPGLDYLLLEVMCEPRSNDEALSIDLQNYPSAFITYENKRGRHILTQGGEGWRFGEKAFPLDPEKHFWFFYQDDIFDRPTSPFPRQTSGPSALVVQKGVAQSIVPQIDANNYKIATRIQMKRGPARIRFALCEFYENRSNQADYKYFTEQLPDMVARLDNVSFIPSATAVFNPEMEKRELSMYAARAKRMEDQEALRQLSGKVETFTAGIQTRQRAEKNREAEGVLSKENQFNQEMDAYLLLKAKLERKYSDRADVLYFNGMFNEYSRLHEGIASLHGRKVVFRDSYYQYKYWAGELITFFPAKQHQLDRYAVVVLDNLPVSVLSDDRKKMLQEYVKGGGVLLVNGGPSSFVPDHYRGNVLAEMLPVRIDRAFNLVSLPDWRKITLDQKWAGQMRTLSSSQPPSVLWIHDLPCKENARVLFEVGGKPGAVIAPYGEGKIIAILATGLGKNPGQTLWEWEKWPALVAAWIEDSGTSGTASIGGERMGLKLMCLKIWLGIKAFFCR